MSVMDALLAEAASRDRRVNDLVGTMQVVAEVTTAYTTGPDVVADTSQAAWLSGFMVAAALASVDPQSLAEIVGIIRGVPLLGLIMELASDEAWTKGLMR